MYVPSIPSPLPHSTTKHRRTWMAVWSGVWSHRRQTCPSSSLSSHSTSQHSRYEHNQFISVYLLKYTEQEYWDTYACMFCNYFQENCKLSYSGKLSREKIFVNGWKIRSLCAEKTFTDCSLVSPPKDATLTFTLQLILISYKNHHKTIWTST